MQHTKFAQKVTVKNSNKNNQLIDSVSNVITNNTVNIDRSVFAKSKKEKFELKKLKQEFKKNLK